MTEVEDKLLRGLVSHFGTGVVIRWLARYVQTAEDVPDVYRGEIEDRLNYLADDLEAP